MPTEADARIVVDRLLREAGWDIEDKFYFLRATNLRELTLSESTHGHLKQGTYKKKPIPVPSPAEQRRIVARLEVLAAKQTELRRLQTETEAELAAFTPALLAKAFRGVL